MLPFRLCLPASLCLLRPAVVSQRFILAIQLFFNARTSPFNQRFHYMAIIDIACTALAWQWIDARQGERGIGATKRSS
jgi:hypothetical protein